MAKNISELAGDLQRMGDNLVVKFRAILPRVISVEGLNHFQQSWDNQGFTDKSLEKWQGRKAPSPMYKKKGGITASYNKWAGKNAGRAILVGFQGDTKGTHLKDSLRATPSPDQVVFETDKAYAQVHNEGGHAGRGSGFEMPRRKFMGPSEELNKKIAEKLSKEITDYLKTLI